ncbi:hypothetical protein TSEDIMI_10007 [Tenacibaculum sediminilitoris]|uniref:hypothetical protein n=1 Tax=Tenacibaculum sediminilitoris TaxID=1820334 RepID=UPI0038930B2E
MDKKNVILLVIIIILGFFIYNNVYKKTSKFKDNFFENLVLNFYKKDFKGVILYKFIDSTDHDYRKIRLKSKYKEEIIFFNYESDSFLNFLKKGDSLIKYKDQFFLRVKRKEIDTVIKIKFDNYIYKNNPNTVIKKYLEKYPPDGASMSE